MVEALRITLIGMTIVFVCLVAIWMVMAVVSKLFNLRKQPDTEKGG